MTRTLNLVPFVSVDHMMKLVNAVGVERFLVALAGHIAEDFCRWELFEKSPRLASHSAEGVIELMPTSDGSVYGFKYVNGHPRNTNKNAPPAMAMPPPRTTGNEWLERAPGLSIAPNQARALAAGNPSR